MSIQPLTIDEIEVMRTNLRSISPDAIMIENITNKDIVELRALCKDIDKDVIALQSDLAEVESMNHRICVLEEKIHKSEIYKVGSWSEWFLNHSPLIITTTGIASIALGLFLKK